MINTLIDSEFESEVLNSSKLVVIDIWAPWCGPCKMLNPIIENLSEEFKDEIKFLKINVDENPEIAKKYNILGVPTLLIFKNGKELTRSIGLRTKNDLTAMLNKIK